MIEFSPPFESIAGYGGTCTCGEPHPTIIAAKTQPVGVVCKCGLITIFSDRGVKQTKILSPSDFSNGVCTAETAVDRGQ